MIVPGVVMAIGIYAVYLDHKLVGTLLGYVLAHSMLAIPFVLITVGASLSVFDARLETAAASLGASRLTTFLTVTLPLIAPGVLSGLLFAFVTSFDEVIVALFINSPALKTLPVQIFASMTRDSDPTVAAVGSLIFALTTFTIAAGLWFGTRRRRS
jgi:putative spermidine/putrescine transport system permease protein